MDIKELLPKDTEGRLRIIQETVPGRQIYTGSCYYKS